ncbi:MAG TPA: Ig-like domain-containing protein, partial [Gemmatimonadales bacterium]|nr:Ig-like domain-containing protein [Gemmatimonadales bacterium]
MIALGLLLLVQQPQTPAPPAAVPSPIARVVVTPAVRTLTAGDTLRLTASALDSAGRAVPNAVIRFTGAGGRFEGRVDSTGLVYAGSTGTLGVAVLASVPGSRPTIERLDIKMLPGAAARLTVTPARLRLVPGQSVLLEGHAWSVAGDPRPDAPRWRSSSPRVVGISADGLVTAVAPGKATITARVEGAEQTVPVEVLASAVAAVEIAPASISARQGDVIRFSLVARDRAGRPIEGLTPIWSFTPGQGAIDKDGAFVGYEAGKYIVTASLGSRAAKAVVTVAWRDVRRPATVVGRLPRSLFTTEEERARQ